MVRSIFSGLMLLTGLLLGSSFANAQAHVHSAHHLIGAPVFAADGLKIGQVADVSTTQKNQIDEIRIFTGSTLGFGVRVVSIPQSEFVTRGEIVLLPNLTSNDVDALPEATSESIRVRSEER
jgi:sporulation protein YlmC with PRC-barrel domain